MESNTDIGWMNRSGHLGWLADEADRVLDFAEAAREPSGGFGWLDTAGRPDPSRAATLLLTCRATYIFSLAALWGRPGAATLAAHGIAAIDGDFRDRQYGGWRSESNPSAASTKTAYDHAFVLLAGATATLAGIPDADHVLTDALQVVLEHFCIDPMSRSVHAYDADWTNSVPYRGANANMHMVEALLATSDATRDPRWAHMAADICQALIQQVAAQQSWRVAEHFDADWNIDLTFHQDKPRDVLRPYGVTPGHGFEWSRLLLQLRAVLDEAPDWLLPAAVGLFERAAADGWDGAGLVYTTDWTGAPIVRERLHWVTGEAISAAATLWKATRNARYESFYRQWWDFAATHFIDRVGGGWFSELDHNNGPGGGIRDGKPDVYHTVQTLLIPRLPISGGLAVPILNNQLATY